MLTRSDRRRNDRDDVAGFNESSIREAPQDPHDESIMGATSHLAGS